MTDWRRWARAGVGLVLAVVIFAVFMNIVGDYRVAKRAQKGTATSTATSEPSSSVTATGRAPLTIPTSTADTKQPASSGKVVIVVVDGVNLRTGPSTTSDIIKALKKDERLTYLALKNGYYQVRDQSGTKGWVSSNRDYTRLVSGQ